MADDKLKFLVSEAESNIVHLFSDYSAMQDYLDFSAKNPHLTYYAASMVNGTNYADTYEGWKERGYNVNAGEHGTAVFQKRNTVKRKFIDDYGNLRDLSSASYKERQKIQNGDLKLSSDLTSFYTIQHLFRQEQTTANGISLDTESPKSVLSFGHVQSVVNDSAASIIDDADFALPNSVTDCATAYATYMLCREENVDYDKDDLYELVTYNLDDTPVNLSISEKKLVLNYSLKIVRSQHTKALLEDVKQEVSKQIEDAKKRINTIKASDITDLKVIEKTYDERTRENQVTFSCNVLGKPDTLVYIFSKDEYGASFSIHTTNDDIFERLMSREMSGSEWNKLADKLYDESVVDIWSKEINSVETLEDLMVKENEFGDVVLNLDNNATERIWDLFHAKKLELHAFGNNVKEPVSSDDIVIDGDIVFPEKAENEKSKSSKQKIEDFGKKIGGARKDLWAKKGLSTKELADMNFAEKNKYGVKNYIFPKPDYQAMVDEGMPVRVAFFIKTVRDAIPAKPVFDYMDRNDNERMAEKIAGYVEFVSTFKESLMKLKTEDDVLNFYKNEIKDIYITQKQYSSFVEATELCHGNLTNKLLRACQISRYGLNALDSKIKKKQFCYSEHDKKIVGFEIVKYDDSCEFDKDMDRTILKRNLHGGTYFYYPEGSMAEPSNWTKDTYFVLHNRTIVANNLTENEAKETLEELADVYSDISKDEKKQRKKKFVPAQLEHIERDGPSNGINENNHATGQMYLDTFGFSGGEFGNWMNEKDRQASLDFGYDALMDLADALNIEPQDISLGGELSIAFGSRGRSGAAAHYEPLRKVINLTKMHGAGSLAHEWGHALDNIFSQKLKGSDVDTWLTDCRGTGSNLLGSVQDLVKSFKYKRPSSDDARALAEKYCESYKDTFTSCFKEATDSIDDSLWQKFSNEVNNLIYSSELSRDDAMQVFANINDYLQSNNEKLISVGDVKMLYGKIVEANTAFNDYLLKPPLEQTDFYKNSVVFDSLFSKDSKGYWQSTKEMFARAFACYISDKLPYRSDYLCGHADSFSSVFNGKPIKAVPEGEERKLINQNFDKVITQLKDLGLLHEQNRVHVKNKGR